ncbi:MAG: mRNA-degrading endonuclease [Chloroflexota bacterium]|nr:MAG: mRNA-degrading endonuclease [Chloroflexota bacterium]
MAYVPERGDAVWLSFTPQAGHEQAGRRPAIVLSPKSYNQKVGLAIFCPITNQIKGYPFEVMLPKEVGVTGVILSDQVKSLDWRVRKAEFIGSLPEEVINEVLAKLGILLE